MIGSASFLSLSSCLVIPRPAPSPIPPAARGVPSRSAAQKRALGDVKCMILGMKGDQK